MGVMHVHDYDMTFVGRGFDYVLQCRCGDVAPDMPTALRRMRESWLRRNTARVIIIIVLVVVGFFGVLWAATLLAARPVCRYPVEMYRPSLGICVPKASFGSDRGRVRHRVRHETRRVRRPPAEPVPLPAPRPDPRDDEVWPDPPSPFEMRFYAVPPS